MKKVGTITLIVCLMIVLVYTVALAENGYDPVLVFPYFTEATEIDVYPGQEVIFITGWFACTRGQAVSFLTSVHLDWFDNDQPMFASDEEVAELWSPIEPDPDTEGCISAHEGQAWLTLWEYTLVYPETGDHVVSVEWWFDHPVNDGYDDDGDGLPDKYSGTSGPWSITIHVVTPP